MKKYKNISLKNLDKKIEIQQKKLKLYTLDSAVQRAESGYNASTTTRRYARNWRVASGTPDELALEDISLLRDRSQDLYRNSSIVRGIVDNKTENSVGVGLKLQSVIDYEFLGIDKEQADEWQNNTERMFQNWAESVECDASRKHNFYELQNLAFKNYQIDGEVFSIFPRFSRKSKEKSKVRVQLLPGRRCENPFIANSETMREGVEINQRGEPIAYWFTKDEGYFTYPQEYTRIPAFGKNTGRRNVLHIYRADFIGQSRGVPFITAILEDVKNIDRFAKNELTNAAVSSLFTAFIKTPRPSNWDAPLGDTTEEADDRVQDYTLDAGAVYKLLPDEDVVFANPARPNSNFESFLKQYLVLIGMAVGLPYEVLVKQFNSSFSASKAARIEAWRHYIYERQKIIPLCAQTYSEWLIDMVALGEIQAPGFFDDENIRLAWTNHLWFGDAQGQIDPTKETQAAIMKIDAGLSTHTEEAAKMGTDFEKNISMLRREKKLLNEIGMGQMTLFEEESDEEEEDETLGNQ